MAESGEIKVKLVVDASELTAKIEEAKDKLIELVKLAERAGIRIEVDVDST